MDRNNIIVIQKQLQFENDCFNRLIIALERLETILVNEKKGKADYLKTVAGSLNDLHNDEKVKRDYESYFDEVQMQCSTVFMCAHYKEEEISNIAIEKFLTDILEWYAGRSLNSEYDTVDLCAIPIINALTRSSSDVISVFEKYVYRTSELRADDKKEAMQNALETYILATHIAEEQANNLIESSDELISHHIRGEKLEGYKYLVKALSTLCESSTPVKMFIHTVQKYLPDVYNTLPNINDDSVDKLFDLKSQDSGNPAIIIPEIDTNNGEDSNDSEDLSGKNKEISKPGLSQSYEDSIQKVLPLLYDITRDVLKSEGIDYKEIQINIL